MNTKQPTYLVVDSQGEETRFPSAADCLTYWAMLDKLGRLPQWKRVAASMPTIGRGGEG